MSRFSNLEFGNESEDSSNDSRQRIKDEAYFVGAARNAFENGEFESALRFYSKVLEFNPDNASAWTGQVRMLIELEEYTEAKLWAEKALERFPHEPELLAAKAVALGRIGDLQGALLFSDAAVSERGETPYIWLARADVLLARGEKLANHSLDKALSLASGDWFITWLAARIRFFYRQFALAFQLAQQAVELDAAQFVLWLELGRCQQALGLLGPARASFTQAQQLNPQGHLARTALAGVSGAGLGSRLRGLWRRFRSWGAGRHS